jgi:glycosyltransferase involved in cell wall biosynthesis
MIRMAMPIDQGTSSDAGAPFKAGFRATVVITTRNRKEDLCRAIESALDQTEPCQILVVDDGSTDGTSDLLRSKYPTVRVLRHEASAGYIVRRNEAANQARGDFIFSLDDDAVFSTPHVIERSLADFEADSRIAAVAIPCIDVLQSDQLRQPLPDRRQVYVTSEYIGTAHAVRRDVFLRLGGYRDVLVHQGEERDFCLRLLEAGYFVRLGTADPIHHFESPKRDRRRQDRFGQRNNVLYAWQNAPLMSLPIHLIGTTGKTIWFGLKRGFPLRATQHVLIGYVDSVRHAHSRKPVSQRTWQLNRRLRRVGAMPLDEAARRLKCDVRMTDEKAPACR